MVPITIALQQRLLDAARRELGPDGESLLRATCHRTLACDLEQVTYDQLPELLATVEREGPMMVGGASAAAMAGELYRLRTHADADLGSRLVRALTARLGPAADPCLAHVCSKLGLTLANLERAQLPLIATVIERDGAALLGPELARSVASACEEARRARPPGLDRLLTEIAREHGGPAGIAVIRELARARLGIDLEGVDIDGIAVLARAVEREGAGRIGAARTTAFIEAARRAIVGPGEPLRAHLLAVANAHLGPAALVFLKRVCACKGVPFEAVSYEHLVWLAEALRAEMVSLVGEDEAKEFAARVRALLPEPSPPAPRRMPRERTRSFGILRGMREMARGWLRAQP